MWFMSMLIAWRNAFNTLVAVQFSVASILCFSYGYTFRGSSQLHLALLHSRELAVYLLFTEQNHQGLTYMLNLVYKHNLSRTAYNMTWGAFGNNEGTALLTSCCLGVSACEGRHFR